MGETCIACGVAVAGADILYTPDGRIVCPRCFANVAMPSDLARPPWRMFAIAGGVAGAVPFAVHVSSSSSTMVNGQVTSFVYRDWIAIACGVVAIALGIIATAAARKEQLQRGLAFAAGIGVVLLGGFQIARGLGVFESPGSDGAESRTSMSITMPDLPAAPTGDPKSPETCPDAQTCFDLGTALKKSDPPNAIKAWERSCDLGAIGGCYNTGFMYLAQDPPALEKATPFFTKACSKGDPSGCNDLGRIAMTEGPTKDLAQAKAMFEKACDGKHAAGCFNLGMMFDQGVGVPQDEKRARELFEKACAGEVGNACLFLGEMRTKGIGGAKDAQGAAAAYTDGCKAGNQDACKALEAKPAPAPKSKKKRK